MAITYNVVTVLDEVRLALGWKGTNAILTDVEINRIIYKHVDNAQQTWQFARKLGVSGSGTLFTSDDGYPYGLMLLSPTFTGEGTNTYTVNASGSIECASGETHSVDNISVTGARVDFPRVMVEMLHWLATHRCQEVSASMGDGSLSASGVKDELLSMADYWTGIAVVK